VAYCRSHEVPLQGVPDEALPAAKPKKKKRDA
jgi:hypothetical protein